MKTGLVVIKPKCPYCSFVDEFTVETEKLEMHSQDFETECENCKMDYKLTLRLQLILTESKILMPPGVEKDLKNKNRR